MSCKKARPWRRAEAAQRQRGANARPFLPAALCSSAGRGRCSMPASCCPASERRLRLLSLSALVRRPSRRTGLRPRTRPRSCTVLKYSTTCSYEYPSHPGPPRQFPSIHARMESKVSLQAVLCELLAAAAPRGRAEEAVVEYSWRAGGRGGSRVLMPGGRRAVATRAHTNHWHGTVRHRSGGTDGNHICAVRAGTSCGASTRAAPPATDRHSKSC